MTESQYRYGFYARPSLALSRTQAEIHDLLRRQYGLISAGLFMPHATVKGFFRSDAEPDAMIASLDATLRDWRPFVAYNNGVIRMGHAGIVISVKSMPDGSDNEAWHELQDRAWAALQPHYHPECEFTPGDGRGRSGKGAFHPHFTLAMADVRPSLIDEVMAFVEQDGLVGPPQIRIEALHLFRFRANWSGAWWHTLTWELLHSWWSKLPSSA